MTRLNAANNAKTTLSGAISAVVTSFYVADASKFPAAPFPISIDNEIMCVQTKNGSIFSNVLRAQEGTTATSHANAASVELRWTKAMYDALLSSESELTINDTTAPGGNTLSILNLFKGLATMIKAITGKAGWITAPAKTLEDVHNHIATAGNHLTVAVSSTDDASSTSNAPLKTAGGLGVAKKAFFGDNVLIGGTTVPVINVGKVVLIGSTLFYSHSASLDSPYTQSIQIEFEYPSWGSNVGIIIFQVEITAREWNVPGGGAVLYGNFIAHANNTNTFTSFDTGGLVSARCTYDISSSGDGSKKFKITFNPTDQCDFYTVFLRMPGRMGSGIDISGITLSLV